MSAITDHGFRCASPAAIVVMTPSGSGKKKLRERLENNKRKKQKKCGKELNVQHSTFNAQRRIKEEMTNNRKLSSPVCRQTLPSIATRSVPGTLNATRRKVESRGW